jgi:hypothetical protein
MRPVAVITPADLAATEPVKVERCEYCDAGPACWTCRWPRRLDHYQAAQVEERLDGAREPHTPPQGERRRTPVKWRP